eukprot:54304-Eustigmatos_ZCMA.PRE.3
MTLLRHNSTTTIVLDSYHSPPPAAMSLRPRLRFPWTPRQVDINSVHLLRKALQSRCYDYLRGESKEWFLSWCHFDSVVSARDIMRGHG